MPIDNSSENLRAIRLLDQLMRATGTSRREMDRLVGYGRGKTAQILSGKTDLKFEHVLDFLASLGVQPLDFFSALFAEEGPERLTGPLSRIFHERLSAAGALPLPARSKADEPEPRPMVPAGPELDKLIGEKIEEALQRALSALAEKARPSQ